MTTKTQAATARRLLSLDDLDAATKSSTPFAFPFLLDGQETGVILKVLGDESPEVQAGTTKLLNQRRKADLSRATLAVEPTPTPVEDDLEFGIAAAALRLVGWEGLEEEPTKENIRRLCARFSDVRAQVMAQAGKTSNFLKLSPAA